jgi:hypothetical protein
MGDVVVEPLVSSDFSIYANFRLDTSIPSNLEELPMLSRSMYNKSPDFVLEKRKPWLLSVLSNYESLSLNADSCILTSGLHPLITNCRLLCGYQDRRLLSEG